VYAHTRPVAPFKVAAQVRSLVAPLGTTERAEIAALASYVNTVAAPHAAKYAEIESLRQTSLQLSHFFVSSSHHAGEAMQYPQNKAASATGSEAVDSAKLAAAALAMDRLTNLIGELQQAHASSVKVAAALAGAVKLAQDGAIDVEDIFDITRDAIAHGSVKLSSIDELFSEQPGHLVGDDSEASAAVKEATGPSVPGFADISGHRERADVLTRTLRGIRSIR